MLNFKKISKVILSVLSVSILFAAADVMAKPNRVKKAERAAVEASTAAVSSSLTLEHPEVKPLSLRAYKVLLEQANQGNRAAQKEIIIRAPWELLPARASECVVDLDGWQIEELILKDVGYIWFALFHSGLLIEDVFGKFEGLQSILDSKVRDRCHFSLAVHARINFVDGNYRSAVTFFEQSLSNGYAIAQYGLVESLMKEYNEGVKDDTLLLLEKAAAQGYAPAQYKLGVYWREQAAEHSKKAFDWFLKAANQNDPRAQFYLGECYLIGRGCPLNFRSAKKMFIAAEAQGSAAAAEKLGEGYVANQPFELSQELKAEWYGSGVLFGNPRAQFGLAGIFAKKNSDTDDQKAFKLFKDAAYQGYAKGQQNLAIFYQSGRGCAKNMQEAVWWYLQAAKKGIEPAMKYCAKLLPLKESFEVSEMPFSSPIPYVRDEGVQTGASITECMYGLKTKLQSIQEQLGLLESGMLRQDKAAKAAVQGWSRLLAFFMGYIDELYSVEPGFMVSCFDQSGEVISGFNKDGASLHWDNGLLTLGEKNIKLIAVYNKLYSSRALLKRIEGQLHECDKSIFTEAQVAGCLDALGLFIQGIESFLEDTAGSRNKDFLDAYPFFKK